jgi:hypothetical protein
MLQLVLAAVVLLWVLALGAVGVIPARALSGMLELAGIALLAALLMKPVATLLRPLMEKLMRPGRWI